MSLFLLSFALTKNTGIVKFYKENKIGYIIDNKTKEELIVYESGLIDEIVKGDLVTFEIKDTKKGMEAYNVRLKKTK